MARRSRCRTCSLCRWRSCARRTRARCRGCSDPSPARRPTRLRHLLSDVPKGPTYDDLRAALDAQWAVLVPAVTAADPAAATRCAGWTVADLDRHLGTI